MFSAPINLPKPPISIGKLSSLVAGSQWTRFFSKQRRPGRLHLLPADILIDEIMSRLDIKDIFTLRRVNTALCVLTHQAAVWKRFLPYLSGMEYPLAAMPPTAKYNRAGLTALDIENILTRAISLDNNWRSPYPRPCRSTSYETHHQILAMALLPGSHFMVASVRDRSERYAVMVWAMEHPCTSGPVPIAIRYTDVKAYHLQARYMTVCGEKGISIAFLRKRHKDKDDTRDIPESLEMGGPPEPEDPFMPLKYECTTMHISLESLDLLTDRHLAPGTPEYGAVAFAQVNAIRVVSRIRTGTQLGAVTLDEVGGEPYVAVVKRPDRIVIENLSTNARSTTECLHSNIYPHREHSIWNLKFIPSQRHMLVLRSVERPPHKLCDPHTFELFPLTLPVTRGPGPNTSRNHSVRVSAIDCRVISHHGFANVQIADLPPAPKLDDSVWPLFTTSQPPPPLSIFGRTNADPSGFIHLAIWPAPVHTPPSPPHTPVDQEKARKARKAPHYYYSLAAMKYQRTYKMAPVEREGRGCPRTLCGTSRAVVYTIPSGSRSIAPSVVNMYAYASPEIGASITRGGDVQDDDDEQEQGGVKANEGDGVEVPVWPVPRKGPRKKNLRTMLVNPFFAEQVQKGLSAIAWDEGIGRLCAATNQDGQLHIMDFAYRRDKYEIDKILDAECDKPLGLHDPDDGDEADDFEMDELDAQMVDDAIEMDDDMTSW